MNLKHIHKYAKYGYNMEIDTIFPQITNIEAGLKYEVVYVIR